MNLQPACTDNGFRDKTTGVMEVRGVQPDRLGAVEACDHVRNREAREADMKQGRFGGLRYVSGVYEPACARAPFSS